jgi:hypothetical protein
VKVNVSREGSTQEVEIDLTDVTSKDMVRFQRLVGDEATDALLSGKVRPYIIDTLVFVKLRRMFPDLDQDDFDFSYSEALDEFGDEDDPEGKASPPV